MSEYYYRVFGLESGPVSIETLRGEIAAGRVCNIDEFRAADGASWMRMAELEGHVETAQASLPNAGADVITWDGGHDDVDGPETIYRVATSQTTLRGNGPFELPASISRVIVQETLPLVEAVAPSKGSDPVAGDASIEISSKVMAIPPQVDTTDRQPQWYVRMGQVERGPMDLEKLTDLVIGGHVLPSDRIRQSGEFEWSVASSIPGLFPASLSPKPRSSAASPAIAGRANLVTSTVAASSKPATNVSSQLTSRPSASSAAPISNPIVQHMNLHLPGSSSQESFSVSFADDHGRAVIPHRQTSEVAIAQSPMPVPAPRPEHVSQVEETSIPLAEMGEPPEESKHKRRRGQFQEPLLIRLMNRRNFNLAACAGAAWLLYVLFEPGRLTISDYSYPYRELRGYFSVLDSQWSQKPAMEFWSSTMAAKNYARKIESIVGRIKKMHSRYGIREELITAGESMLQAISAPSNDDVTSKLEKARNLLKGAERQLIAADKGQQNG